jgi:hypothetical protein
MNAHVVRTIVPGGKMPPSTAGKDACRYIFRQALKQGVNEKSWNSPGTKMI